MLLNAIVLIGCKVTVQRSHEDPKHVCCSETHQPTVSENAVNTYTDSNNTTNISAIYTDISNTTKRVVILYIKVHATYIHIYIIYIYIDIYR